MNASLAAYVPFEAQQRFHASVACAAPAVAVRELIRTIVTRIAPQQQTPGAEVICEKYMTDARQLQLINSLDALRLPRDPSGVTSVLLATTRETVQAVMDGEPAAAKADGAV